MKSDLKLLCVAVMSLCVVVTLAAPVPVGAQNAGNSGAKIAFKVPLSGGGKKDVKRKADPKEIKGDDKKDEGKENPFTAQEETLDGKKWGIVSANGKGVMGIPVEAGGFTPLKRAQLVAERMGDLRKAGTKFKQIDAYVVGKLNGEIVLAMKSATDPQKVDLLFTIDSNLDKLLNAHAKAKKATRPDIAFYWRDILIKALQGQSDIAGALDDKDAWAKIPAGYAQDKSLTPLTNSQINPLKNNNH